MLAIDANKAWYFCGGKKVQQACVYVLVQANEKMCDGNECGILVHSEIRLIPNPLLVPFPLLLSERR